MAEQEANAGEQNFKAGENEYANLAVSGVDQNEESPEDEASREAEAEMAAAVDQLTEQGQTAEVFRSTPRDSVKKEAFSRLAAQNGVSSLFDQDSKDGLFTGRSHESGLIFTSDTVQDEDGNYLRRGVVTRYLPK